MASPTNLPFIFRQAWLLMIAANFANCAIWWSRAQSRIASDPSLEKGYKSLIKGLLIWGNLPWIVAGAGVLTGSVKSTFSYFNVGNGPFVIAFYLTVVIIWCASIEWIFFRQGAEKLIRHPGLFAYSIQSPKLLKLLFLLCLAGGIIGLSAMLFLDIQIQ